MTWVSTVPAALDGLVAAVTAALPDVKVIDGMTVGPGAKEAVTIGYQDDDNPVGVEVTVDPEGFRTNPGREMYSIMCAASVLAGSGKTSPARVRAYQLLAAVFGVLAADKTLGGVVLNARIGAHQLMQTPDQRGTKVTVMFSVDCDAFTSKV